VTEILYSINKAQWDALDPEVRTQIGQHLDGLRDEVEEGLRASDEQLFIDATDRRTTTKVPQSEFWQQILHGQDVPPAEANGHAIEELERLAKQALTVGLPTNEDGLPQEREGWCDTCQDTATSSCIEEPDAVAPGDQPPPVQNDGTAIQSLVIEDVEARLRVGIQRYGTPLQAFNGRDALWDAYQEALDLVVYLRQMIAERDGQ
jgi:hypothetical protein